MGTTVREDSMRVVGQVFHENEMPSSSSCIVGSKEASAAGGGGAAMVLG